MLFDFTYNEIEYDSKSFFPKNQVGSSPMHVR